ncbi:hypothetical protein MOQ_007664, partial [Trypanosoma cruzi marinkellei]
ECPPSACTSAAVLLAVQGDVSAAADDSLPLGFVVLDIRPLAPCLPFAWHFTWAETCALVCALHGVSVPQRECLCCMCTVASVSYFPFLPLFSLLFLAQHTQFSAKGRAKANPHAMSSAPDELFGKYRMLIFNGRDLSQEDRAFKIKFTKWENDVEVRAVVVNVMSGYMEYRDGKLTGGMASTLSLGRPFLMEVEDFLRSGFAAGMEVFIEGEVMTLSCGEDALLLVAE